MGSPDPVRFYSESSGKTVFCVLILKLTGHLPFYDLQQIHFNVITG